MANKVVQLIDNNNDNIFPVAGSMAGDSVTTGMIQDEAVTADKFAQYAVNSSIKTADNLSPDTDTTTAWKTLLGNGYFITRYTSNIFSGQPEQYGILETIIDDNRVFQRWQSLSTNPFYYRGGNDTGWNGSATYPSTFSIVPNNNYSTTERAVGTWIDGKTIYRRVIEGTASTTNGTEMYIELLAANIVDTLVNVGGYMTSGGGQHNVPSYGPTEAYSVYKQPSTTRIFLWVKPVVTETATYKIWIEYTKN